MIITCAKWLRRAIKLILLITLLLVASYASLGRYYIDYVQKYHQFLVEQFSEYTGLPVEVGSISGRWTQLSFILSFNDIVLPSEKGKALLSIPRADFKVNPLQSLWHQRFLVDSVSVDGLSTSLEELAPGRWRLAGFEYQSSDDGSALDVDRLLDFILAINKLEFFNTRIDLKYHNDELSSIHSGELFLRHHQGFRRVRLQASLQDAKGVVAAADDGQEPIDFLIEATGDPRDINFSAKAYLKFDDVDLVDQLPILHSFGINPEQVRINSSIWLDWKPGRVITVQGGVDTPLLDLGGFSGHDIPAIQNLSFNFSLEKNKQDDWQLWLPKVQGVWKGQSLDIQQTILGLSKEELSIALATLNLEKTTQTLLNLEVLPEKAQQALATLSPKGELNRLSLSLPMSTNADDGMQLTGSFELQAELASVEVGSWSGAPAAKNVDGYIQVNETGGVVSFSSEPFELAFPKIYAQPMSFDVARARVAWQIDKERVLVNSSEIVVRADHGPAVAQLALDIPLHQGEDEPRMFLAVGLKDTDAAYRNKFIPSILSLDLLNWLDSSIKGGEIKQAGFIYDGSLLSENHQGRTVQLYLDVKNGQLDYQPGWPVLSNINAVVVVDDAVVSVVEATAISNGIALDNVDVMVKPLDDGGSWLTVNSHLNGNAEQGLAVVNSGKLRSIVGDVFSDWQLSGDMNAQLSLALPIANTKYNPDVHFTSYVSAGSLTIPEYRISLDDFYGPFEYHSDKGVLSGGIQGQIFNKKTVINLEQGKNKSIKVHLQGSLAVDDVATWTQFPGMTFLEGETAYEAEIVANGKQSYFSLSSDLQGVAIDLPEPFAKQSNSSAEFNVYLPMAADENILTISLGEVLSSHLRLGKNKLVAGALILNPVGDESVPEKEFVISGSVESVVVSDIAELIKRYVRASNKIEKNESKINPKKRRAKKQGMVLRVEGLNVEQADLFGLPIKNTKVELNESNKAWLLAVDGEQIKADVIFPHNDKRPVKINVHTVSLSSIQTDQSEEYRAGLSEVDEQATEFYQLTSSVFDDIDLDKLQAFDFSAQQIILDEQLLGNISFELRPSQHSLMINNIGGEIRKVMLGDQDKGVSLLWEKNEQGSNTQLTGSVSFLDLGTVFEQWGLERSVVSKNGRMALDLAWAGAPDQFQMALAQGAIDLEVKNGIFLKTTSGATGALRVVSVLNMNNILRRLRLDFTDLFKAGVSFDEIKGQFKLVGGRLYIIDYLNIESPSSRFRLSGSTSLNTELLDMDLVATLPVGKNLPWIAALMGGLPAAAIVYGAGKLFENQVDKFSSAVYSIEGKWDDPQLKLKRVFDAKGQKSLDALPQFEIDQEQSVSEAK